jgi:hypothetical protein
MKTKKEGLNLNKFTVAKLNNLTKINGGNGGENTGTQTDKTLTDTGSSIPCQTSIQDTQDTGN